ncbi:MAG: histone deacetylase [Actinobacteria bacterium]|nr:histone deacetylase [Actinomycetota bacterium]
MPGHPESPPRLVAVERRLEAADWLGWERRPARAATREELELVHTPAHVAAIRELSESGGGAIDVETYDGPDSYRAAAHGAGGAAALARALLAGEATAGFSALRPPGHHAEAERAMGFCLFDSIAVAAALATGALGAARVLILDWDVHHGNGTEAIFRGRDDVLYISLHQAGIWPGTGRPEDVGTGAGTGFTLNLPVPEASGRDVFLSLIDRVVAPVATEFGPDLILISAGFDAHREDPLAGLALTSEDFGQMAVEVRELGARIGAPVGAVLEGGYAPRALAESVEETMRALGSEGRPAVAPETEVAEAAAARVGAHWPAAA